MLDGSDNKYVCIYLSIYIYIYIYIHICGMAVLIITLLINNISIAIGSWN